MPRARTESISKLQSNIKKIDLKRQYTEIQSYNETKSEEQEENSHSMVESKVEKIDLQ